MWRINNLFLIYSIMDISLTQFWTSVATIISTIMDISLMQFWTSVATIISTIIALYSIIQAKNLSALNFRLRQFEMRPEIRVIEAEILQKPRLEKALELSGLDRLYYKISLKNTGNSEAIIEQVEMKNESGNIENILSTPTQLAPGQEYVIPIYTIRTIKKQNDMVVDRIKTLKIFYKDIFKNKIVCEASIGAVLSEPTPYLGIRTNIIHNFSYPKGFIPKA